MDSKEGAFRPRSMRLRKSIEMSRFSANCCWVMPRRLRIERSFLPNCFRKVATSEVWLSKLHKNTEHYYGFSVHSEIKRNCSSRKMASFMISRAKVSPEEEAA